MVNGIISLISFWCFIVGVYKWNIFFVLILHPVTLPNSMNDSSCFLVASLGFFVYSISSTISDCLLLVFQFGFVFYLFHLLLLWLELPILCWIKAKRVDIFVLFLIWGNTFRFLPLSMMLAVVYHVKRKRKLLNCVWLCVTPGTVTHQAPLVHGILQARILEWVAVLFSKGSFQPRDWIWVSWIAGCSLQPEPPGKPRFVINGPY